MNPNYHHGAYSSVGAYLSEITLDVGAYVRGLSRTRGLKSSHYGKYL